MSKSKSKSRRSRPYHVPPLGEREYCPVCKPRPEPDSAMMQPEDYIAPLHGLPRGNRRFPAFPAKRFLQPARSMPVIGLRPELTREEIAKLRYEKK